MIDISLVCSSHTVSTIANKRVILFSYGSGLASSMFSMQFSDNRAPGESLDRLVTSLADLRQRLDARHKVSPEEFDRIMKLREETHHLGTD